MYIGEVLVVVNGYWWMVFWFCFDYCVYFVQWFGYVIYWLFGKGSVVGQGVVEWLGCQQIVEQMYGSIGVIQVDWFRWCFEVVQVNVMDGDVIVLWFFDYYFYVVECLDGCQCVFVFEEVFYFGGVFGQGVEYD